MTDCQHGSSPFSRRELLRRTALGFPLLALAGLEGGAAPARARSASAKRVIFLFMHGGPSQLDTFDYKPRLQAENGKPLPIKGPRITFNDDNRGGLLASPFRFKQHGECGAWVSEIFPEVAKHVDKLCFVKSLHGSNDAHGGALLKIHTGSDTFVRPSIGSWIVYGLGSENRNLPGYITICPTLGHGGVNNWSSAFLPAEFQGTPIGNASVPADRATIAHLTSGLWSREEQRHQLDLLAEMNDEHARARQDDDQLRARMQSLELAFRMQTEAPGLMDVADETDATRKLYGLDDAKTAHFGRQCLMARRFAESGVRFVQCTHSYKWDQHSNLEVDHRKNALEVDRPIAGLLHDLDARGLLADTLVLWAGEFGRTPVSESKNGRDHNPHGFTVWMAGGGVKSGFSFGATDDYGYFAVQDKVHVHDLHATILHLLGLDHEKLTYRYAGRDFRLTDVYGRVVNEIIA